MLDSLILGSPYLTGGTSALIIVFAFVLLLYIITALIGKPLNLSLGPLKLNFLTKKINRTNSNVVIVDDNIQIQKKQLLIQQIKTFLSDSIREKTDLEYDTLRRQLNYAEEKVGDIKAIMSNTYTDLLKSKLKEEEQPNVKSHKEYKTYQMLLTIGLNECVVKVLKKGFKTNHLNDMDELEWKKYVEHKKDIIIQQMSEFLDIMYDSDFLISREELSEGNDLHLAKFRKEIDDILTTGKEIYLKNKSKIELLEEQINTKINELMSNNGEG